MIYQVQWEKKQYRYALIFLPKMSRLQLYLPEVDHRISEGPFSTVITHNLTNPVFVFAGIHFIFIFMRFSGKVGYIIGWISHIIGLDCPRKRNPGSATVLMHAIGRSKIYVPNPLGPILFFVFMQKTWPKQECIPVGCVPSATIAVCCRRGVCSWGGTWCGGVPGPGGYLVREGWYPSIHWGRPPPVNRMTDRQV